jgi:hypothetical protein
MHILAILATVEALAILALGLAEWLHGRLDAERDRAEAWRAEAETWSVRWAHRGGNHAQ